MKRLKNVCQGSAPASPAELDYLMTFYCCYDSVDSTQNPFCTPRRTALLSGCMKLTALHPPSFLLSTSFWPPPLLHWNACVRVPPALEWITVVCGQRCHGCWCCAFGMVTEHRHLGSSVPLCYRSSNIQKCVNQNFTQERSAFPGMGLNVSMSMD